MINISPKKLTSTLGKRVLVMALLLSTIFLLSSQSIQASDFVATITPDLHLQAVGMDTGTISHQFDPGDSFQLAATVKNESAYHIQLNLVEIQRDFPSQLYDDSIFSFKKNNTPLYVSRSAALDNFVADIVPPHTTINYQIDFSLPTHIGNEDQGQLMQLSTKLNFSVTDPPASPIPTPVPTPTPTPTPAPSPDNSSSNNSNQNTNNNSSSSKNNSSPNPTNPPTSSRRSTPTKNIGNLTVSTDINKPFVIDTVQDKLIDRDDFTANGDCCYQNNCHSNHHHRCCFIIIILLIIIIILQIINLLFTRKKTLTKYEKPRR